MYVSHFHKLLLLKVRKFQIEVDSYLQATLQCNCSITFVKVRLSSETNFTFTFTY